MLEPLLSRLFGARLFINVSLFFIVLVFVAISFFSFLSGLVVIVIFFVAIFLLSFLSSGLVVPYATTG